MMSDKAKGYSYFVGREQIEQYKAWPVIPGSLGYWKEISLEKISLIRRSLFRKPFGRVRFDIEVSPILLMSDF